MNVYIHSVISSNNTTLLECIYGNSFQCQNHNVINSRKLLNALHLIHSLNCINHKFFNINISYDFTLLNSLEKLVIFMRKTNAY